MNIANMRIDGKSLRVVGRGRRRYHTLRYLEVFGERGEFLGRVRKLSDKLPWEGLPIAGNASTAKSAKEALANVVGGVFHASK